MDIQASLTNKIGPAPVWIWAVGIVGGGYFLYNHFKSPSAAATDTSVATPDPNAPTQADYQAGLIQADYSLLNALGTNTGSLANLATNVGANTTAVQADTSADVNGPKPSFAVVSYGGRYYELGKETGAQVAKAQMDKSGVRSEKGAHVVKFGPAVYQIFPGRVLHMTPQEYAAAGHPKATVVSPNTTVNLAPAKVR